MLWGWCDASRRSILPQGCVRSARPHSATCHLCPWLLVLSVALWAQDTDL